ncbi:splicing regulatory glutamine/lysine-rich protein 1-like [Phaenicophaeus curvirostris]|uniref:splicing regulatory glutamine/lysine-rich protein 1-like n=1 Tax=Phaenicophaeus curvirostris TaxID=33595 RepID=UPI0037F0A2D1
MMNSGGIGVPLGFPLGPTPVIQVTNLSPAVTSEQMRILFGFLGDIEELRLYPPDNAPLAFSSKVCYIKFREASSVGVAQHLTNTVFIDRALIVVPCAEGKIPDEAKALSLLAPAPTMTSLMPGAGLLPIPAPTPLTTLSVSLGTLGAIPAALDPNITALGEMPQPPIMGNVDPSKIDEIRRTVYVGNLNSQTTTADQLLEFFKQVGEVKFVRMAGDETQPTRFAFVEFADQNSVPRALAFNGVMFGDRPLKINHSNNAIVKPPEMTPQAAAKELEEVMKRVREAQSFISAAIEPESGKSSERKGGRSHSRSRSESRSSSKSRSRRKRSHSKHRSRSGNRLLSRHKDRHRSRSPLKKQSRSRERRKSRSRSHSRDKKRDKEKDKEKGKAKENEKEKEKDRDKDKERERKQDKERNRDKDKEKDQGREREQNKDQERVRDKDRDREKDKVKEKEKDREERDQNKEKDDVEKEGEKDREKIKDKEEDKDKGGDKEDREKEKEKDEDKEKKERGREKEKDEKKRKEKRSRTPPRSYSSSRRSHSSSREWRKRKSRSPSKSPKTTKRKSSHTPSPRNKKEKKKENYTNNKRREREHSTSKKKSSKEKERKEKSDKSTPTLKVQMTCPAYQKSSSKRPPFYIKAYRNMLL